MKNRFFISIIGLLILGALTTVVIRRNSTGVIPTKYDEFAKCIASKNLTMYGAVWCSHCKAEKARFGDSFKYVPYIECTEDPNLCIAKGIESYPTWIDRGEVKYTGEQGLQKLSEISGCGLPSD